MHLDLQQVDKILDRYPRDESSLVMVLQDVQAEFNYLPCEALEHVANKLAIPRSRVFSVATFYKVFSLKPQGRTIIQVCKGTACHVRGAQLLEDELCRQLGVPVGTTTEDLGFTIKTVNCVGACAMAPVVIVGEEYHAEVKPAQIERMIRQSTKEATVPSDPVTKKAAFASSGRIASPAELLSHIAVATEARQKLQSYIQVCGGPGCLAGGAREVFEALRQTAQEIGLKIHLKLSDCKHEGSKGHNGHNKGKHLLSLTGCQGLCQQGVLVHLMPEDLLYTQVKAKDAREIVEAIKNGTTVERLVGEKKGRSSHPFYQGQDLRALGTCGQINPESLDDYLSLGGFQALAHALTELSPDQVLQAVDQSGLRGRGGAGFATGKKWTSARRAAAKAGQPPYILCNGDEGDPGAFMDRAIMEGSPYQVIEGMILGAFALRGREGYIYVRAEYPLAVTRLELALETCRNAGLLGKNILGNSDFNFDIRISRGGGAFVCGESTALMRSIEGKVGEPRAKYVRSVERGLYDSPTVLNNVETWALVPGIVFRGPQWLTSIGTKGSSGTKAFSLVGQVQRTGLVEVPMGTTLRQLIFSIGGGVRPGRTFKAVQTGGPSGGCLPESQLDRPIDFDALTEAGSMMGSGGMIVMDDQTCMVDVARYFVDFLQEESCGKCVPCRLGLPQLSALLRKVSQGKAQPADLDAIEEIARGMADNSLCGLGKSAPNPVLSTLQYFREEYQAHLEGRCPAGVCKELIHYQITEGCTGCMLCLKPCPVNAISGNRKERHTIDQTLCTKCGICRSICQHDAIQVVSGGTPQ